jgi:BirA family transcriptional regulator, biotin operon repressor / biotin---[acetyl-CoA-carboxylase] ligase
MMVNKIVPDRETRRPKGIKMKGEILKLLKAEEGVLSGERLSEQLEISRVSVWKHIKKLQECGYTIISTPKGYELKESPDTPFSWEFPRFEDRIHYFPEVDSTMNVARTLARKGADHLSVVIADRQTNGRGRLRRQWFSDTGGLYFTIIVRPVIAPVMSFRITFSASLALVRILRRLFPIDAKVKWPNDILVEGKKLSGMLSEMETEADLVSYINIGLGINISNDPRILEPNATSLKILLHRDVSRIEILNHFLNEFESVLSNNESKNIISQWKEYSGTLNHYVKIVTISEKIEGIAKDVDETGALILELSNGAVKRVIYGDCFHQPDFL